MAITELLVTKIYVVDSITASLPPAVKDRIVYEKATKKLKIYNATSKAWEAIAADNVVYAANASALTAITGAFDGQIGIDGEKNQLYVWSNSAWQSAGGSGSITLVANKEALPDDADAGDIAIVKAENVLYYYDGAAWVSTEPKVNIDEVYVAAGNISVGSKLENLTLQEFAERLLTKEINPAVTQPSASIAISGLAAGLQEIGTQATLSFTSTFNRGNVKKGWGDKATMNGYYSGLPTTYTYTGPGLPSDPVSSTALTDSQSAADYIVTDGAQSWKVVVAYEAGDYQPVTNYGNNYSTKCAAGTKTSNTLTITGVYPVYATTANITTLTKQSLMSKGNIQKQMAGETASDKWTVQYPASWGDAKGFQVADVGSTNFNYMGGGQAQSLALWTKSDTTVDVNENAQDVPYKQYKFNGPLQGIMQLKVILV